MVPKAVHILSPEPVNMLPYTVRGTLQLWVSEWWWGGEIIPNYPCGSNVIIKVLRRGNQEDQSQKKQTHVKIKPVVGMAYFGDGGCDYDSKNVSKLWKLDEIGKWIFLLKPPEGT